MLQVLDIKSHTLYPLQSLIWARAGYLKVYNYSISAYKAFMMDNENKKTPVTDTAFIKDSGQVKWMSIKKIITRSKGLPEYEHKTSPSVISSVPFESLRLCRA